MKSKEYLKGMLDAKLSKLLSEADYLTFAALDPKAQIAFFTNANLVTHKLVSDFEALVRVAKSELADEISNITTTKHPLYKYFFMNEDVPIKEGSLALFYNALWDEINNGSDDALKEFINKRHLALNLLLLYRGKVRGFTKDKIVLNMLKQTLTSTELLLSLYDTDASNILSYVKNELMLELSNSDTLLVVEDKVEAYLVKLSKEYATSPDLEGTLIYYINAKLEEINKLRTIFYTKEEALHA